MKSYIVPTRKMAFVLPKSISIRNITNCSRTGAVSAEFLLSDVGVRVVDVSGAGRVANDRDKAEIDAMLQVMHGMDLVSINCQLDGSAFIMLEGTSGSSERPYKKTLTMQWGTDGAKLLP